MYIRFKGGTEMTVTDLLDSYISMGTIITIYFSNSHIYYHGNINDFGDTISFIFYKDFVLECKNDTLIIIIYDEVREKHKEFFRATP